MTPYLSTAFQVLCFAPGPLWLALIFFPRQRHAMMIFDVALILLSVHFTLLTIPEVPQLLPVIAKPTFEGVSGFLTTPKGIVGSWNHMILSDLWIGRWIVYDGIKNNLSRVVLAFVTLTTLFFGPMGLCLYVVLRFALRREWRLLDA